MNYPKMDPLRVREAVEEGRKHSRLVSSLYRKQLDCGKYFLREHPSGALSWKDDEMLRLIDHPDVDTVISHQCEYGLVTRGKDGLPTPAKKPTRWASNSPFVIKRLSNRCKRGGGISTSLLRAVGQLRPRISL